jgi:hypothetical protein
VTRTPTPTRTFTPTPTVTPTRTVTRTPTPTLPISAGPQITFFGLTTAFNTVLAPTTIDDLGRPVYTRVFGAGFFIVVEAKPGSSGRQPGTLMSNSDPTNPAARPDLQILANKNLGNGSPDICDTGPLPNAKLGGVPGFNPPDFDPTSQAVADALNDFGCRFDIHVDSADAVNGPCTLNARGIPAFVKRGESTLQYCTRSVVGVELHFLKGDTLLTVQVRDSSGNIGFPQTIVLRVP